MITAVDSSVLVDVLVSDPLFGPRSKAAVHSCTNQGRLIACSVVWAEIAGYFSSQDDARNAIASLGVEFSAMEMEAALAAGRAWKMYRQHGGGRTRMIADFLIGAHAQSQADRLLTRDRGFYRAYFSRLEIVDPTKA